MATTVLTLRSERAGQATLGGTSTNLDSGADFIEVFRLPVGFGDCFIMAVTVVVSSLQTVVAPTNMRGPSGLIFDIASVATDMVELGEWRRSASLVVTSQKECLRPVLFRAEEVFAVQSFSEDTGAGDTSDLMCILRVARIRNQSTVPTGRAFTYPRP